MEMIYFGNTCIRKYANIIRNSMQQNDMNKNKLCPKQEGENDTVFPNTYQLQNIQAKRSNRTIKYNNKKQNTCYISYKLI